MRKKIITRRILPFLFALGIFGELITPSPDAIVATPPVTTIAHAITSPVTTTPLTTAPISKPEPLTSVSTKAVQTTTSSTTVPKTTPSQTDAPSTVPQETTTPATTAVPTSPMPIIGSSISTDSGKIKVHFINVGQADSIFIELPNDQTMLIDAGTSSSGAVVAKYVSSRTSKLTYAVASHPHADHIGGMAKVINSIPIERFIMPRKQHTTATFEGMLDALIANDIKVTEAKTGVSILDTRDLDIDILGPHSSVSGSNLNNYSAIIRIRYKSADFLFVGDAESSALSGLSEMNMDVLKVGHHGSDTSSPLSFLKKVDPEYSVISVGNNSYGHPARSSLANLNTVGSKVYRTDISGTLIITSDGKNFEVNKNPAKAVAAAAVPVTSTPTTKPKTTKPTAPVASTSKTVTIYGTATGSKYHKSGCRYLSKSKIPMTLSEAKADGLTACSVCH